ncbi:MAG: tRNA (adenosine(37)-N6)-dimethylallyltransferase MiaA [Candidatus Saelkia tenebricola]|nr:tRNA (adenosine(37)-N6)-dimethylallyltransferase MiaA [Candidatus Saelkia tenebricola]
MSNSNSKKSPIIVITGCTGVGKTNVSLELADMLGNAEIVSCDSMAVYREMNIGTSKPSKEVRNKIPHHLVDVVSIKEDFDVAKYVAMAEIAISEIVKKDNIPIIVGGSVMYLYSLLDGIFKGPGKNSELRGVLTEKARINGVGSLHKELEKIDPHTAVRIHSNDLQRIIRAIEVYYQTGNKISELKKQKKGICLKYNTISYGITSNRGKIYNQIDSRVDEMIKQGLVDEVKNIWNKGMSLTAYQGQGYKEIIGYLEGKYDFNEAIRLTKRNTRRYAKRQISWLKRDKRVNWINIDKFDSMKSTAEFIFQNFKTVKK